MTHRAAPAGARPELFGTDGVRDRAGEGLLSDASLERLGAAIAACLQRPERFPSDVPAGRGRAIVLARDTRASGPGIADILAHAFVRAGHPVLDVGVLATPGAAWLAATWREACLAVVISASHNPACDNGVKLLAASGAKVSLELEEAVASAFWEGGAAGSARGAAREDRSEEGREAYIRWLLEGVSRPGRLRGRAVALDTAHGSTFEVAPEVFRRLGMRVHTMGDAPDGTNINEGCGATRPAALGALVLGRDVVAGFTFDGDGDRMVPVAPSGAVLDGDHVLYVAGRSLLGRGELPRRSVVATVMSNIGLELALGAEGVRLLRTDVGDRWVYLAMVEGDHPLGGEQSGHVIFLRRARTGDGVLAALELLDGLESDALDLEAEASGMRRYPQVLKNVRVREKSPIEQMAAVVEARREAEALLAGRGRVLLRYSGTEPLLRVMAEGPTEELTEQVVDSICEAVRRSAAAGP